MDPLREIEFSSPDDGMVKLRPCFINHKIARYNRVTPPSIQRRQEEEKARQAAEKAHKQQESSTPDVPTSSETDPAGIPSEDKTSGFTSSLRKVIRQETDASSTNTDGNDPSSSDMVDDDIPPAIDDDGSDDDSAISDTTLTTFLNEEVDAPTSPPTAPLWAKAATNRRALLGKIGTASVEVSAISYESSSDQGTAHAVDLVKANYWSPLWWDDLDPDSQQWHFDVEIYQDETQEVCIESSPLHKINTSYVSMITPVTMVYDVEKMTRLELAAYISNFVDEFVDNPALEQLATIEANPGIMLTAIESKRRLDNLAVNRALCRLVANARPGNGQAQNSCFNLLQAKGDRYAILERMMKHSDHKRQTDFSSLLTLSAWDGVLHVMAPTVYHDPAKLLVLTGDNPQYLTGLTIPLLADHTLWQVALSTLGKEILGYNQVPNFLKSLISEVQALKPSNTGELAPRLRF
ncbi:Hypothetical protein PHPALM_17897 [Phytophthora palmivora]|uniref:Uncharacterized protein n=1 Tax=Phytophthora palmivora TaxID=4796 RepID=A0A2P4XL26_9STRA|nr:Hypothetical protein PHPALM_17897 [Phytophthora palmivora]